MYGIGRPVKPSESSEARTAGNKPLKLRTSADPGAHGRDGDLE